MGTNKCLLEIDLMKVYRPAAKSVPFAEPNVEIATDKGISQAITPNIKLPKV